MTVDDKVFGRVKDSVYGAPESDWEGNFEFDGEPLPEWLHAEREVQDDGRPGCYIIRPGKEDFENRWPEILTIIEPYGMRLGIVKVKVPDEL